MAAQSLNSQPPLIAVVGPTASGKTALGVELARRLGGEVVSADSGQMYRGLDAGTSKPPTCAVSHHLIDVLDPSEQADAGRFAELARAAIDGIRSRGKRPIVVGGTGLYLKALLVGLDPLPRRDERVRERLAELVEANGRRWLHEELERADPEAARRIPPDNLHRVMRALEVYELTGRPISEQWTKTPALSSAPAYGILWRREELAARIRARCEESFPKVIEEVRRLVPARYTGREPGFKSLGYPEALSVLRGEVPPAQALERTVRNTLAYAKRQATWFRGQAAVRWLPAGDGDPDTWAEDALKMMAP